MFWVYLVTLQLEPEVSPKPGIEPKEKVNFTLD